MKRRVTVPERVAELVRDHGGVRQAARACGIGHVTLHRLAVGTNLLPQRDTLARLGLREDSATFELLTR